MAGPAIASVTVRCTTGARPGESELAQADEGNLDRALKRDLYLDCTPRSEEALAGCVQQLKDFGPRGMVA